MIRLKDIAASGGVSVMTVSKVLRDAPDISAATKVRIKELAKQMGYVPDSMAQGLRNKTTKLFGLIIASSTNPVFARTVSAIEDHAHQLGYDVILCHTLNNPEKEEQAIRRLLSRRVDGIFLCPVYRMSSTAPIYEELKKRQTPTVIMGHLASFCSQFINVETDDLFSSSNATRHLINLGHRRIAFFKGQISSPSAQERFEGYRRALREAQIEFDDKLVFNAGNTIEEGSKAALQFLDEMPNATAIQAFNDLVAIGACEVFIKQGLKIPTDLSIVGFGNILLSEYYRVPLTTVRQPKARLGTAAIEVMMKLLNNEPVEHKRIPAELVTRESTAPPIKK